MWVATPFRLAGSFSNHSEGSSNQHKIATTRTPPTPVQANTSKANADPSHSTQPSHAHNEHPHGSRPEPPPPATGNSSYSHWHNPDRYNNRTGTAPTTHATYQSGTSQRTTFAPGPSPDPRA